MPAHIWEGKRFSYNHCFEAVGIFNIGIDIGLDWYRAAQTVGFLFERKRMWGKHTDSVHIPLKENKHGAINRYFCMRADIQDMHKKETKASFYNGKNRFNYAEAARMMFLYFHNKYWIKGHHYFNQDGMLEQLRPGGERVLYDYDGPWLEPEDTGTPELIPETPINPLIDYLNDAGILRRDPIDLANPKYEVPDWFKQGRRRPP